MKYNSFRPRIHGNTKVAYDYITKKERRILVIGDIHAPFVLDGYLEFCKETYARHNCNQVIFIGDILDNHYSGIGQKELCMTMCSTYTEKEEPLGLKQRMI
jgi:hypothetical protein